MLIAVERPSIDDKICGWESCILKLILLTKREWFKIMMENMETLNSCSRLNHDDDDENRFVFHQLFVLTGCRALLLFMFNTARKIDKI